MGLRISVGAYFHFSCALGCDHAACRPVFSYLWKRRCLLVLVLGNHHLLTGQWSVGGCDQSADCRAAPTGTNTSPQHPARGLAGRSYSRSFAGRGAPKSALGSHPADLPCPHDHLWPFALRPEIPCLSSKSASAEHGQHAKRVCFPGIVVPAVADGDGWFC